jgi:hypothetical protein
MALKSPKARDLDLRSVWLLDNQSTFDLCCNPDFAQKKRVAKRAMNMSSNGGDMKISKECKVLGYEFWVWYTQRAMTNILSLKNLIRLYRVTYDSEKRTSFIVHREEFGLPDMVFDMHPCGLHVYYPEKIDGQYGFVQTVAENMKLFTKRQIDGALQARHLYETLGYPSNADFNLSSEPEVSGAAQSPWKMQRLLRRSGDLLFLASRGALYGSLVIASHRAW